MKLIKFIKSAFNSIKQAYVNAYKKTKAIFIKSKDKAAQINVKQAEVIDVITRESRNIIIIIAKLAKHIYNAGLAFGNYINSLRNKPVVESNVGDDIEDIVSDTLNKFVDLSVAVTKPTVKVTTVAAILSIYLYNELVVTYNHVSKPTNASATILLLPAAVVEESIVEIVTEEQELINGAQEFEAIDNPDDDDSIIENIEEFMDAIDKHLLENKNLNLRCSNSGKLIEYKAPAKGRCKAGYRRDSVNGTCVLITYLNATGRVLNK